LGFSIIVILHTCLICAMKLIEAVLVEIMLHSWKASREVLEGVTGKVKSRRRMYYIIGKCLCIKDAKSFEERII